MIKKVVSFLLVLLVFGLAACTKELVPPVVPTGKAIDVTQANTSVEFDFKIKEAYKYDVVLEIFDKIKNETGPLPKATNAHFKIRIKSLDTGQIIVEQEVKAKNDNLARRSTVAPSQTEKTELMKFTLFLLAYQKLDVGNYHVFVENINPINTLQGRLVKASILQSYLGK